MFARMIDDFKYSTGRALRLTSLAAVMALALGITISFLCAAAFVYVLQQYGLIEACLTGAGVFLVVTLIAAGCYLVRQRQVKARANVDSAVDDLSERGSAAMDAAQDTAHSIEETLEDLIQERPLATVGLALGLGFLIGAAWRR